MASATMENYPAAPPPPGVTPNFVDPETRAPAVIAVSAVCLGLMWPVLTTRLYSKAWILRTFGWDDGMRNLNSCNIC